MQTLILARRWALTGAVLATMALAACNKPSDGGNAAPGSVASTASGSSSNPSIADYTAAVKADLQKQTQASCWSLPAVNGQFPSVVKGGNDQPDSLAMRAAMNDHLVTVQRQAHDLIVALTPAGKAAHAWNATTGTICLGREELVGDVQFTGGDPQDALNTRSVQYTWHRVDLPAWASDEPVKNLLMNNDTADTQDQYRAGLTPATFTRLVKRPTPGAPLAVQAP